MDQQSILDARNEGPRLPPHNKPRFGGINSVQAKVLAVVVPFVLLATFVTFGFFELRERAQAEDQLLAKLTETISIQSSVVAEPLWNLADDQVDLIISALLTDSDIVGVVILDEDGSIYASGGDTEDLLERALSASMPITYQSGNEALEIGTLQLALSDEDIVYEARQRRVLAVILAAILVCAIVLANFLATRRIVGRPLNLLIHSIEQNAGYGGASLVNWQSKDEIGAVVSAFNDMQRRQEADEAELRASRDDLEKRVEMRTKDLEEVGRRAEEDYSVMSDAIDSISEGFAIYDGENKLRMANRRYRELMTGDPEDTDIVGATAREVLDNAFALRRFVTDEREETNWQATMKQPKPPPGVRLLEMADGRW